MTIPLGSGVGYSVLANMSDRLQIGAFPRRKSPAKKPGKCLKISTELA
jgi:hypothetical protein